MFYLALAILWIGADYNQIQFRLVLAGSSSLFACVQKTSCSIDFLASTEFMILPLNCDKGPSSIYCTGKTS